MEDPTMRFTKFPELPSELQIRIFEYALPKPRSVDGVILVIIGRNLGKPRAILPRLLDFKEAYCQANDSDDFHVDDDGPSNELWDPANRRMQKSRRFVFNLLHTCKTARTVALSSYRLDMHSIIPEENVPWWDPELDNLYFQPPFDGFDSSLAVLSWLGGDTGSSLETRVHFRHIQHATFCLDFPLASLLGLFSNQESTGKLGGLLSLPTLETLNLLLDPGKISRTSRGKILYYEPENIPVSLCRGKTPTEIQRHVQRLLEKLGPEDRETPDVNLFVMGVRAPKVKY